MLNAMSTASNKCYGFKSGQKSPKNALLPVIPRYTRKAHLSHMIFDIGTSKGISGKGLFGSKTSLLFSFIASSLGRHGFSGLLPVEDSSYKEFFLFFEAFSPETHHKISLIYL